MSSQEIVVVVKSSRHGRLEISLGEGVRRSCGYRRAICRRDSVCQRALEPGLLFNRMLRRSSQCGRWEVKMIVRVKEGYQVLSEKGKNLGGPYKTRDEAKQRLRQVEFFKRHKLKTMPRQ
jgi:hypothetical protein